MAQIQPFDTKLFIDAAEYLIDELWELEWAHGFSPQDPSLLNVIPSKWARIHCACVRLSAQLNGGDVYLLACRYRMQIELEHFWQSINRLAGPFFEKRPLKKWPLVTHADCKSLGLQCDIIRALDGIVAATPEEVRAQESSAFYEAAKKLGIQSQSDWLAKVLEASDQTTALMVLMKERLEVECNELQAQVGQIDAERSQTKIEKGIPGRPVETTTPDLVEFVKRHRSRKPPTPWKTLPDQWKAEYPKADTKTEEAMRSALYRDQKKKRS